MSRDSLVGFLGEIVRLLGEPLAVLFCLITRGRNWCFNHGVFPSYRSSLPVLSVGNLSVGGNGKTPLVIEVASLLRERGWNPVILSRGYGGSLRGPVEVTSASLAEQVGDEPLLLLRRALCPVVVARRRVAGARLIEERRLGNVIILDDGFQHRWLWRDLDIVVANIGTEAARQSFLEGRLLPCGSFREDRDEALRRARALVLMDRVAQRPGEGISGPEGVSLAGNARAGAKTMRLADSVIQDATGKTGAGEVSGVPNLAPFLAKVSGMLSSGTALFRASYVPTRLVKVNAGASASLEMIEGRRVMAWCALGQPEAFFATLRGLGAELVRTEALRDHASLPLGAIAEAQLGNPDAVCLCTEKDAIKIPKDWSGDLWYLEVGVHLYDRETLLSMMCTVLPAARKDAMVPT